MFLEDTTITPSQRLEHFLTELGGNTFDFVKPGTAGAACLSGFVVVDRQELTPKKLGILYICL